MGITIPVVASMLTLAFKMGGLAERVAALEKWREAYQASIRGDMHEISELLTMIRIEIQTLKALVKERTDRRIDLERRERHTNQQPQDQS